MGMAYLIATLRMAYGSLCSYQVASARNAGWNGSTIYDHLIPKRPREHGDSSIDRTGGFATLESTQAVGVNERVLRHVLRHGVSPFVETVGLSVGVISPS